MARKITTPEFRRLLFDIRDRRPDVRVRFRFLGKMWNDAFTSIHRVEDETAILFDAHNERYYQFSNLHEVVQFELECPFFGYHAFYHYDVLGVKAGQPAETTQPVHRSGRLPSSR